MRKLGRNHKNGGLFNMENTSNNVAMKLNVKIHRIYGQIQSSIMTFGINKGYFVSVGMGLLSIAKIIFQGYLDGWATLDYDIRTLWPLVITLLSTVFTLIVSVTSYKNSSYTYNIIQDDFYKNQILDNIRLSEKQMASGYQIMSFDNGVSEEKYIMSDEINFKLIHNPSMKAINLNYKFQLADEIKTYVPSILKRSFMSNRLIFNGKLIRMANDIYKNSSSVNIQSVRYFEGQCTNEIIYKKIKSNHSLGPIFLGKCLLVDDKNILYDLEHSSCANYIGASTITITKDRYIIIGKQGDFSRANAGRYAPSGSGSVNYSDLRSNKDLNSLIISAMEREFCEENNYIIKEKNKIKTILIGYVRLLERGGKPDFFGISFIDDYSNSFNNNIKKTELGIEDENLLLKIPNNSNIGETLLNFCNSNIEEKKISIQLMILAELISKYEQTIISMCQKN